MNPMNQSSKKIIKIAGVFFLLMVIFGLFSEILVRQRLIVVTDAVVTASNILSHPLLYRLAIVSDILMAMFYLFTSFALYYLLESVNKKLASVMVVFTLAGSVMLMINVLNLTVPIYLLEAKSYLDVISLSQRQAFSLFYIELFNHGYMIGQVFFALWVLPLGLLILRSKFIPKVFGIFFIIESACYLLSVLVHFIIPGTMFENLLHIPGMIAEFSFLFWLLISGFYPFRMVIKK